MLIGRAGNIERRFARVIFEPLFGVFIGFDVVCAVGRVRRARGIDQFRVAEQGGIFGFRVVKCFAERSKAFVVVAALVFVADGNKRQIERRFMSQRYAHLAPGGIRTAAAKLHQVEHILDILSKQRIVHRHRAAAAHLAKQAAVEHRHRRSAEVFSEQEKFIEAQPVAHKAWPRIFCCGNVGPDIDPLLAGRHIAIGAAEPQRQPVAADADGILPVVGGRFVIPFDHTAAREPQKPGVHLLEHQPEILAQPVVAALVGVFRKQ